MSSNAPASITYPEIVQMIDTFDRPGKAYAKGTYARSGTYDHGGEDKPGRRLPRVGAYAGAGVGKARAEIGVLEAEANGPNASARAEASLAGVGAMAKAEIASVSAGAGPVKAKLGLGVDTGVNLSLKSVEAKVLGTGITLGPRVSVSVLGSEVGAECVVM